MPSSVGAQRPLHRRDLKSESGSHARELELKRSRGEISCAECRRLKIKCDKQIPCHSCQRRGCAALCPTGSLETGQGTRFVVAATDHLHRRIAKMGDRIRSLEDALAALQAAHSSDPHPLLRDELLVIKLDPPEEREMMMEMELEMRGLEKASLEVKEEPLENTLDAFGTLTLRQKGGVSHFLGPTGGTERLLLDQSDSSSTTSEETDNSYQDSYVEAPTSNHPTPPSHQQQPIQPSVAHFSHNFPLASAVLRSGSPSPMTLKALAVHLPTYPAALKLCETYKTRNGWLIDDIMREQLFDNLLPRLQHRPRISPPNDRHGTASATTASTSSGDGGSNSPISALNAHEMGLLFAIFAIASLVEASTSPNHDMGAASPAYYYSLALSALTISPLLEKPSEIAVQALHLMSTYHGIAENRLGVDHLNLGTSMEASWGLITLAGQLAQAVGLHRDSSRWGLPPDVIRRRRQLFVHLFVADAWQSLNTGRPPSINTAFIDLQLGGTNTERLKEGQKDPLDADFTDFATRFAFDCIVPNLPLILNPGPVPYTKVLETDAHIRSYPMQKFPELEADEQARREGRESSLDPEKRAHLEMQRYIVSHTREAILLYLHRGYFAQAIHENPDNPLSTTYGPSFRTAFESAVTILRATREHFAAYPEMSGWFWQNWGFALFGSLICGGIISNARQCSFASEAVYELDLTYELFKAGSQYSRRALRALPIIGRLRDQAHSPSAPQRHHTQPGSGTSANANPDELSIVAGHTRLVSGSSSKRLVSTGAGPGSGSGIRAPDGSTSPPTAMTRTQAGQTITMPPLQRQASHQDPELFRHAQSHQHPPLPHLSPSSMPSLSDQITSPPLTSAGSGSPWSPAAHGQPVVFLSPHHPQAPQRSQSFQSHMDPTHGAQQLFNMDIEIDSRLPHGSIPQSLAYPVQLQRHPSQQELSYPDPTVLRPPYVPPAPTIHEHIQHPQHLVHQHLPHERQPPHNTSHPQHQHLPSGHQQQHYHVAQDQEHGLPSLSMHDPHPHAQHPQHPEHPHPHQPQQGQWHQTPPSRPSYPPHPQNPHMQEPEFMMYAQHPQQRELQQFGLVPQAPRMDDQWNTLVHGSGIFNDVDFEPPS